MRVPSLCNSCGIAVSPDYRLTSNMKKYRYVLSIYHVFLSYRYVCMCTYTCNQMIIVRRLVGFQYTNSIHNLHTFSRFEGGNYI